MPFLDLTFLYLVNIQPNSKFHPPPTKIFWIRPCISAYISAGEGGHDLSFCETFSLLKRSAKNQAKV